MIMIIKIQKNQNMTVNTLTIDQMELLYGEGEGCGVVGANALQAL